jgi:hypothetical protein
VSNPIKGETSFTVEGKTYTLKYSAEGLISLEERLDRGILDILEEMEGWAESPGKARLSFLRTVFWAGLQESHPEVLPSGERNPDGIDEKKAGQLMLDAGGLGGGLALVFAAMASAFPKAETKGARPPNRAARRKAAAGTGKNS